MQAFDLDSGALCLDFANTVDWHTSDSPVERIENYLDLVAWGEAAGVLTSERAHRLRKLEKRFPKKADAALLQAIHLREAIFRIFSSLSAGRTARPKDLETLNEMVAEAFGHLQVRRSQDGFRWDWTADGDNFNRILWPVARSAAELLTTDDLDRVRECADDRGCGYLFIDRSRNRSRRWCSMDSCGNRAKARRHYARSKEDR